MLNEITILAHAFLLENGEISGNYSGFFFFKNVTARESSAYLVDNACFPFALKEIEE